MNFIEIGIVVVFVAAVALPFIPGMFELRLRHDNEPLRIDPSYTRDPRFLGKSLRRKIAPLLESPAQTRAPFLNRSSEVARVVDSFDASEGARVDEAILARGTVVVGRRSTLRDVYAKGRATIGEATQMRTLTVDGGAVLGSRTKVGRWIDVDGDCTVGRASDLGRSASVSGALLIGEGSTFHRVFGLPVAVGKAVPPVFGNGTVLDMTADHARTIADSVNIPPSETIDGDVIASGDVTLGAGSTLRGSIKAGGRVVVHANARVLGNVVAHGDVSLERNGAVYGHVFGDREVALERGATVGRPDAPKTLHASERVTMATDATVHGWAIAERGGRTVASILVLALLFGVAQARADEWTSSTNVSTFSSPGNLYGPWETESLEYQWQAGTRDVPSVTVLDRTDNDRAARTHSSAVYLDDYHTWSPRFFTYAQIESSTGTVLPNRGAYVEADQKFGPNSNLLIGAGAGVFANPDASITRVFSVGPSYYSRRMVYTARLLTSSVSGSFTAPGVNGTATSTGSAVQLIAEYNALGRDQFTVSYLGGRQPGVATGTFASAPVAVTTVQNVSQFSFLLKHWVRRDFGFQFGATLGAHKYVAPPDGVATRIYNQNAFTFGVFVGRAIGLPKE